MAVDDLVQYMKPHERGRVAMERLARVIWLRVVERQAQRAIAELLGVSAPRVHQLEYDALRRLRWGIGRHPELKTKAIVTLPIPLLDAVFGGSAWRESED